MMDDEENTITRQLSYLFGPDGPLENYGPEDTPNIDEYLPEFSSVKLPDIPSELLPVTPSQIIISSEKLPENTSGKLPETVTEDSADALPEIPPDEIAKILEDECSEDESIVKKKPIQRNEKQYLKKCHLLRDKRLKGEEYINCNGNIVEAKTFSPTICDCLNICHEQVNYKAQKKLFDDFYNLASYDLQQSYLYSLVHIRYVTKTNTKSSQAKRVYSGLYYLPVKGKDEPVCRHFFISVFQTSDGRITRLLKNKMVSQAPPTDKRGKKSSINKTSEDKVNLVINFINKFPKYDKNYTQDITTRQYLAPDLNVKKMHQMYLLEHSENEKVSFATFRKIFLNKFNLDFLPPVIDKNKIKLEKIKELIKRQNEKKYEKKLMKEMGYAKKPALCLLVV